MVNYYRVLGVSQTATSAEIKAAYRNLAKQYHPDKCTLPEAICQQKMIEINMADEVLSDSKRKAEYDAGTYNASKPQPPATDFQPPVVTLKQASYDETSYFGYYKYITRYTCDFAKIQSYLNIGLQIEEGINASSDIKDRLEYYKHAAKCANIVTYRDGHEKTHIDESCIFITNHRSEINNEHVNLAGNIIYKFLPKEQDLTIKNSVIKLHTIDINAIDFNCKDSTIEALPGGRILLPHANHVHQSNCKLIGNVVYGTHYTINACTAHPILPVKDVLKQEEENATVYMNIQNRIETYQYIATKQQVSTLNQKGYEETHVTPHCAFITNHHSMIDKENINVAGTVIYKFKPEIGSLYIQDSNISLNEIDIDAREFSCKNSIIEAKGRILLPPQAQVFIDPTCQLKGTIVYDAHYTINACSGKPAHEVAAASDKSTAQAVLKRELSGCTNDMTIKERIEAYKTFAAKEKVSSLTNGHEETHISTACAFITNHHSEIRGENVNFADNIIYKFKPEGGKLEIIDSHIYLREIDIDANDFICRDSTIQVQGRILLPGDMHIIKDNCELIGTLVYGTHYTMNPCTANPL